jgi:hypothetical protein
MVRARLLEKFTGAMTTYLRKDSQNVTRDRFRVGKTSVVLNAAGLLVADWMLTALLDAPFVSIDYCGNCRHASCKPEFFDAIRHERPCNCNRESVRSGQKAHGLWTVVEPIHERCDLRQSCRNLVIVSE